MNAEPKRVPWASGPGEILRHALDLLRKDSDVNRRLAMISIDNAVELMIKTYLGLPKRVTGLPITRKEFQEAAESFPALLDALERHSSDKLDGVDLGAIEWYHRLRNELYHQGNGLTVERDKVEVYAELANILFRIETEKWLHDGARTTELTIPLYGHAKYNRKKLENTLSDALQFVLSETVRVLFALRPEQPKPRRYLLELKPVSDICLFSGGTDSFSGLLAAKRDVGDVEGVFCAHADQARIIKIVDELQREVFEAIGISVRKISVPTVGIR
jgi:hypothetical protein